MDGRHPPRPPPLCASAPRRPVTRRRPDGGSLAAASRFASCGALAEAAGPAAAGCPGRQSGGVRPASRPRRGTARAAAAAARQFVGGRRG